MTEKSQERTPPQSKGELTDRIDVLRRDYDTYNAFNGHTLFEQDEWYEFQQVLRQEYTPKDWMRLPQYGTVSQAAVDAYMTLENQVVNGRPKYMRTDGVKKDNEPEKRAG